MIDAIIFDMDGLLVDSEPYWDQARKIMAAEAGIDWNSNDHKAVMGVSTQEWVEYMIARLSLTISPAEVEGTIISNMRNLYRERIPFLPGAEDSVALAAKHFPTGLASGSPRSLIETVTGSASLIGKFQAIFSGDEVSSGKPSPDIYLTTAEALGIAPEKCVCLEDSGNGILAGKNAGMKVIAVPDPRFAPSAEKLAQADIVLNSLQEFSLATLASL